MAVLTVATRPLVGLLIAALFAATSTVVTAAGPYAAASTAPRVDEYRLKAALIFAIARFVYWPAETFVAPATPMHVCVFGADPFGPTLDETFKGHTVGGRPIAVRRITNLEPVCNVLFVSRSERKRMALITDQLRSSAVLTVSEEDGFRSLGGMVELYNDGEKVRFSLNFKAIEAARLRLDARLVDISNRQDGGDRR